MSDQLFDFMVLKNKGTDMPPAPRYGIVKAVYLAADWRRDDRLALAHRMVCIADDLVRLRRRPP